jgi:hypothetical protein
LPRGNQGAAAEVVAYRGLTTRQTEPLVAALLAAADAWECQRIVNDWRVGRAGPSGPEGDAPPRPPGRAALRLGTDIGRLHRAASRLETRLRQRPRVALGAVGAVTVRSSLKELGAVLSSLQAEMKRFLGETEETR